MDRVHAERWSTWHFGTAGSFLSRGSEGLDGGHGHPLQLSGFSSERGSRALGLSSALLLLPSLVSAAALTRHRRAPFLRSAAAGASIRLRRLSGNLIPLLKLPRTATPGRSPATRCSDAMAGGRLLPRPHTPSVLLDLWIRPCHRHEGVPLSPSPFPVRSYCIKEESSRQ